jgi:hypothetical protein
MTTKGSPSQGRRPIHLVLAIFAGAATIAALALGSVRLAEQATPLSAPAGLGGGAAKDDPSDPGWSPPVDPGPSFPTNPGWSSQSDPGWNASPGWDFQPSP